MLGFRPEFVGPQSSAPSCGSASSTSRPAKATRCSLLATLLSLARSEHPSKWESGIYKPLTGICDQVHLAGSISRRSFGLGDFTFDANNQTVVTYITDFLMLGDTHQRLFIMNLLKVCHSPAHHAMPFAICTILSLGAWGR